MRDILGMPTDALLYGLFGALITLSRAEKTTRKNAFTIILTGMIIAGVGADLIKDLTNNYLHLLTHSTEKNIRMAAALFLGACWQNVISVISERIKRWGGPK